MKLKKSKAAVSKTITSTAVKPTPEVSSKIDQLPLKALSTNKNVHILKDEKFFGDVAALREHVSNQPIPIRSALLTPGGHLRRKDFNKENEVNVRHDEHDQNLSSDTLSMSGLLSSSKVQGNSTKTSREDDYSSLTPVIDLTQDENGVTEKTNSENTQTNSSMRNRKRTRSNDPSNCTPPKTANALDVYYNNKHRLTPSPRTQSNSSTPETPKSTPPKTANALDVFYNSKHRLIPSPRSQSNSSTPETPRNVKTNLDAIFDRNQRLTPSPNRSKNQTTESGNSTPVAGSHNYNGLHSSHSTNFLGSSNSNLRNFDANVRSPRLLTRSNSQFSSVSDLRDFAIKSSQSVISWPSQKLRTPNMKQFTIKNIGGKKLTMKIEVIGPGFQVSDANE